MAKSSMTEELAWQHDPPSWGWADVCALLAWTAAIVVFFWKAVSLQEAMFYFDITEINYPYRDFFARELRAGRFSRWHPGLYCGMPLFSESQVGYLHPFKYLLYPWLETWKAFNLDTILSVWLTGVGAYGWLRRHVGPAGALTGASAFGLSGFVWAHLIHTSMVNALASVPFLFWALEAAWEGGRLRPLVLGSLAMACQVFAGHLQDTILTAGALGLYTLYWACTSRGRTARVGTLGMSAGLVGLALLISAVQWVPSKELLDRSPRAEGLSWDQLTYGSWHPELLPALVVREAYGTRARDTDWMDGFYPYHEMNTYMGLIVMALAILGGAAYRDRWVAFWILLVGIGGLLMLGRFTWLLDHAHRVPIAGSSRIPVRFHLWVSLAVSALAAVGVDRLARPGVVRLRGALLAMGVLVVISIPILIYVYAPAWNEPGRWPLSHHLARFRWLGRELTIATVRTFVLAALGWSAASWAAHSSRPRRRAQAAAILPLLVIVDLLGAHIADVPTITPRYWTEPPLSARLLKADPGCIRVRGFADRSSGEPGYDSEPIDFMAVRDRLAWSLPPVWGLASAAGETPLIPRRTSSFGVHAQPYSGRLDIEGVSHVLAGRELRDRLGPGQVAGSAFIYHNPGALPRVRLMGRPAYVAGERQAIEAIHRLKDDFSHYLIVEDPDRPLAESGEAQVPGTVRIVTEIPERVEVAVDAGRDAYLAMSDSYDPGWTATLDGKAVPIRPAWIAFRAVYVPRGRHTLVFTYRPTGFASGLSATAVGLVFGLFGLLWPRRLFAIPDRADHATLGWPRGWPRFLLAGLVLVVLSSILGPGTGTTTGTGVGIQRRWLDRFHRFTWGAGIESMRVRSASPPSP